MTPEPAGGSTLDPARSLRGAIAASVTPLRDGGAALHEDAIGPLVRFLSDGGLDGVLALGTTGEGVMLSVPERMRAAERFVEAAPPGFAVAVHCGAQTTADTVALAEHAAACAASAVAVIAPPYFAFDSSSLTEHFGAAAAACAPVPFYVYEFAERSGYSIPVSVVERLRERAPNLRGLKVSDTPFPRVLPYLLDGLDVFIGSEPLVLQGLEHGAVGAVSGLASAFPDVIAALVHERDPSAHRRVTDLRDRLRDIPFQSAMKVVLGARGVCVRPDVRSPLRTLTPQERRKVAELVSNDHGSVG